jgi:ribosomal protein S9
MLARTLLAALASARSSTSVSAPRPSAARWLASAAGGGGGGEGWSAADCRGGDDDSSPASPSPRCTAAAAAAHPTGRIDWASSPHWQAAGRHASTLTWTRGFASGGAGDGGSNHHPPPPSDEEEEDWGAPAQTLADVDDLLDDWEDLMEAGDLDGVLRLLEARTAGLPGLPPLADVLAAPTGEADERALRRALEAAQQAEAAARRVRLVDAQGRAYGTGRRKAATARVWVRPGSGRVWVNGSPLDAAFSSVARRADVLSPLAVTAGLGKFDVRATVSGGGTTGQAQAVRHGLARALQAWDPALRPALKAAGLLTRDARVVERKKPGKAKARKSFQWVKR